MVPGIGAASSAAERMVEGARSSVVEVSVGRRGGGAGVIWPVDALVLTNDHVVSAGRGGRGWRRGRRSSGPRVTLRDGRAFDAEVLKRDGRLDLALLRLKDAPADLSPAAVGASGALRVGELVFAVGHPWGRPGVATVGIVSGLAGERGWTRHIMSDVSLAPGNSGGPLLNASGEVVGINAMVSGGFAFSVPSDVASAWVSGFRTGRPRLGVGVVPAGVRGDAGLAVALVKAGGPADRAGIIVGDVLLGTEDGASFGGAGALFEALARAGETARLRVLRGGEEILVSVDLEASGPERAA
ncbi:trypsin-like serine protease [Rubrobacter marinus]|uniref:Trypsin-like serine protease n=1 Tax=Rubrobacter marinus TaxID=2653852 RepID=A0A6G8PZA6_9ACTN|nr:trypsin-like peptidase domain-containing protein [Rubrobacter marinus]QIN79569.1 trypsin-like serine protease [Rubrobacter marinus]